LIEEAQYSPVTGAWYHDESGQLFEIVAVDEHHGTISPVSGRCVAEFDLEGWETMEVRAATLAENLCVRPLTMRTRNSAATTTRRGPHNWGRAHATI